MNFRDNIYLVGFMGAGKSTVGKTLAKKLNWDFIDTDSLIEERTELAISELFAVKGEAYFRDMEEVAIRESANRKTSVVALGGGATLRQNNWREIKSSGVSIYLKWPAELLVKRILRNESRPLVARIPRQTREKELIELVWSRAASYEQADLIINCSKMRTVTGITETIINWLIEK